MAIVKVQPRWKDGQAEEALRGIDVMKRASLLWDVDTDSAADSEVMVLNRVREAPSMGQSHPDDNTLAVMRRSCRREGATSFLVGIEYGPADEAAAARTPQASWSTIASVEATDTDAMGRPLMTAASEGFDPPLTRTYHDPVLTYSQPENGGPNHVALKVAKYVDHVASDRFWGWKPGTPRMDNITGQFVEEDRRRYWWMTYTIAMREDGWRKRVLNQGTKYVSPGDLTAHGIVDADGQPLGRPQLLDEKGYRLTEAEVKISARSKPWANATKGVTINGIPYEKRGPVVWLLFDMYPPVPFGPLGLKQTAATAGGPPGF